MSDGSRLRQTWYSALNNAEAHFRQLLSSTNWKRLSGEQLKWKAPPDLSNVVVHRSDNVLRLVLDLPMHSDGLEPWKAILSTPELRQNWDPAVEEAHMLELIDPHVRICKTKFTLGWPANPRDAVTLSRMFHDSNTLIDISTSLPRSADEPAYLRPSPPYVRSHVALFAWCIQRLATDSPSPKLRITCFWQHDLKFVWSFSLSSPALHQQLSTMVLGLFKTVLKRGTRVPYLCSFGEGIAMERVRYQVDRQALTVNYALVPPEGNLEHQRSGASSVVEYILPSLEGWDLQLSIKASSQEVEKLSWVAQALRRSIVVDSDGHADIVLLRVMHEPLRGDHEVLKARLIIEVSSASRGIRLNGVLQRVEDEDEERQKLEDQVEEGEEILRDVESAAGVSIITTSSAATGRSVSSVTSAGSGTTLTGGSSSGMNAALGRPGERTPAAEKSVLSRVRRNYIYFSSLLQEPEAKWRQTMDARGVSITQLDSIDPTLVVYRAEATFVGVGLWDLYGVVVSTAAKGYWDKTHDDAILLEDLNGLTELWHIKTKPAWPVNGRDTVLLRTVYKSPTSIHVFAFSADADPHLFPNNQIPLIDTNVIRTQVDLQGWAIESLSPTTTLLTLLEQSDMKGWTGKTSMPSQMIAHVAGIGEFAIKSGGPPAVTRLSGARKVVEKFDWEKASLRVVYEALKPSAIKSRSVSSSISTRSVSESTSGESIPAKQQQGSGSSAGATEMDMIECEIRCDIDTWAASLDIVVDPPPQGISCLRRHKLSLEGGGLWLTLTHDPVYPSIGPTFLNRRKRSTKLMSVGSISELQTPRPSRNVRDDEAEEEGKFRVIVRRAPGKEKGLVMVNGTKVTVDVEEMPESEVKNAMKQRRIKPARVPLDQPPVVNVVRKRRAEWNEEEIDESQNASGSSEVGANAPQRSTSTSRERTELMSATREWATAPKQAGALTKWWLYAVDVAASTVVPASTASAPSTRTESMPSKQKWPMQYALEALEWIMEEYAEDKLGACLVSSATSRTNSVDSTASAGTSNIASSSGVSTPTADGWTFVGEKAGLNVHRKLISEVSPVVPVHRGTKIIEGVSAEELASVILHDSCRKEWDDKFDSSRVFESFGWGCETGFTVMKGGFPFRDRGFYLARVIARAAPGGLAGMFGRIRRSRSAGRASSRPGKLVKRNTDLNDSGTDGRRVQQNAIFIVSASYSGESDSVSRFSPSKYNEYVLPIGRVFVDAWVLETLDPYDTREIDVAIPSTRCTRVVAVDLRGSAPAAVNSMVNVAMVRALSTLGDWVGKRLKAKAEAEGKGDSTAATNKDALAGLGIAAPFMRMPGGNIMLREARGGMEGLDRRGVAWCARVSDRKRALVKERFKIEERVYRCMMLVSVGSVLGGEGEVKEKEKDEGPVRRTASRAKSPRSPSPTRVDGSEQAGHSRESTSGSHNSTEGIPSSPPATARGRAASSPYAKHRGLRMPADLLVAELVIDSKMYPDGYDILMCSRKRSEEKIMTTCSRDDATCISLKDAVVKTPAMKTKGTMETMSLLDVANASVNSTTTSADGRPTVDGSEGQALPLGYTVHTMPLSPMHSSGLAAESPMRHLVRVTLPTAQYQIPTVEDPLTGETRSAPPKPSWLTEMEEGGSAIVEIEVRPRRDKVLSKKKGAVVRVNGSDVSVESEKESLTSLGREELMDDRLVKMPVLVMVPNEAEALPEMLRIPLAVADDLLDPTAMKLPTTDNPKLVEEAVTEPGPNGEPTRTAKEAAKVAGAPTQVNSGGFLGFLQSYPNPLTRFASGSISNGSNGHTATNTGTSSAPSVSPTGTGKSMSASSTEKVPGGFGELTAATSTTPRTYPLSTVVIVALIAFLIGSLLRSLLSPADFIYVVQDLQQAEDAGVVGGWREIRRLFEMKYVLGGWDFQIAVVRRH